MPCQLCNRVTLRQRYRIIKMMNKALTKSCPLDSIPSWLLKRVTTHLVPFVCHLYCVQYILTVWCFFQAQLRQARVIPLLKKANMDPDTASSYRPISNLSYLSKLVEGVVTSRLKSHVFAFILLLVQQSAYRPLHSTGTAVLSVHNYLVRSIYDGQVCPLVLVDLSVAFDTVDHQILLSVPYSRLFITRTVLSWF